MFILSHGEVFIDFSFSFNKRSILKIFFLFILLLCISACGRSNPWENKFLTSRTPETDVTVTSAETTAAGDIVFYWELPWGITISEIRITCSEADNPLNIVHTAILTPVTPLTLGYTIPTADVDDETKYNIIVVVVDNLGTPSPGTSFCILDREVAAASSYFIYTEEDLDAVRGSALSQYNGWGLTCTYNLMADLDLSAYNWVPLGDNSSGTSATRFTGTFEGNGHTISNLTIATAGDYKGLFGYIESTIPEEGHVRNLNLINASVTGGNSYVGTLAGLNEGEILGCNSAGTLSGVTIIGGLVGSNSGTINNSHTNVSVTGSDDMLGGLLGANDTGIINYCQADGSVMGSTSTSIRVGGLVGYNSGISAGTISNSNATGNVTGWGSVGGLIGTNNDPSNTINTCSASGAVTGTANNIGGLIGQNVGAQITNCIASGAVLAQTNTVNYVGGLIGENGGIVDDCHATGRVTGRGNYVGGLIGYNTSNITNSTYINTTNAITSSIAANYIGGLAGQHDTGTISNSYAEGSLIANGVGIFAIGGLAGQSTGTITAGSHAAVNVTVTGSNVSYIGGLIGNADGVTINDTGGYCDSSGNITVTSDLGSSLDTYVGGLVGASSATTTITGAHVSGTIDVDIAVPVATASLTSNVYVGGLAGHSASTTINSADTTGPIEVTVTVPFTAEAGTATVYAGGLIGGYSGGAATITNSQSQGNINASLIEISGSAATTQLYAGGFIGENQGATLTTCRYITGTINVSSSSADTVYTGGLAGYHLSGTINTSSYTSGTVVGVSATTTATGGLVGRNYGTISASYSTANVTGANYTGGFIGNNTVAITGCSASVGTVTGTGMATGGFAGRNSAALTGCWATCDVYGTSLMGGLVGWNSNGAISGCYAEGDVRGTGGSIGGLIGINNNALIANSFATGYVETTGNVSNIGGLVGENDSDINAGSYATGGVSGALASCVGGLVGSHSTGTISGNSSSTGSVTGTGFTGGLIGQVVSGTVTNCDHNTGTVTGTIHVGGLAGENSGEISYCTSSGIVNGSSSNIGGLVGHNATISAVITHSSSTCIVTGTDTNVGGLVGWCEYTGVTNSFAIGSVTGTSNVGGLAGYINGTTTDCYATGHVTGSGQRIGGFVGMNYGGSISVCHSTGQTDGGINSTDVGGFAGHNSSSITTSYSTGIVRIFSNASAGTEIGGFVGTNSGTITVSFCKGSVTADYAQDIGGFFGYNNLGTVRNCYTLSNLTVNYSVSSLAGGFGGKDNNIVEYCYVVNTLTGAISFGGFLGDGSGGYCYFYNTGIDTGPGTYISDTDLQSAAILNANGWLFGTIWEIDDGTPAFYNSGYPYLLNNHL